MERRGRVGGGVVAVFDIIGATAYHTCRRDEGEGARAVGLEAERHEVGAA